VEATGGAKELPASGFGFAGAVLTYFGFMHGEAVGVGGGMGVTPGVALAYAVVAAGFLAVGKFGASTSYVPQHDLPIAAPAE
jgi:adenine/guanine/hypoxanthine permease